MAVNMLFTFVIGQCFTTMLCAMRYGVFLFFAGIYPLDLMAAICAAISGYRPAWGAGKDRRQLAILCQALVAGAN